MTIVRLQKFGVCPRCLVSWDGGEIPEQHRKHYSPPYRFSKIIGITDPQKDRTVAYRCPECGTEWNADAVVFTDVVDGTTSGFRTEHAAKDGAMRDKSKITRVVGWGAMGEVCEYCGSEATCMVTEGTESDHEMFSACKGCIDPSVIDDVAEQIKTVFGVGDVNWRVVMAQVRHLPDYGDITDHESAVWKKIADDETRDPALRMILNAMHRWYRAHTDLKLAMESDRGAVAHHVVLHRRGAIEEARGAYNEAWRIYFKAPI